jgi:hypothetical protein
MPYQNIDALQASSKHSGRTYFYAFYSVRTSQNRLIEKYNGKYVLHLMKCFSTDICSENEYELEELRREPPFTAMP